MKWRWVGEYSIVMGIVPEAIIARVVYPDIVAALGAVRLPVCFQCYHYCGRRILKECITNIDNYGRGFLINCIRYV